MAMLSKRSMISYCLPVCQNFIIPIVRQQGEGEKIDFGVWLC